MRESSTETVLDAIVRNKREEIVAMKAADLPAAMPLPQPGLLEAAFRRTDRLPRLMLEIKPASPSAGTLAQALDLDALVHAYNAYGVAISVLTDEKYFGGSLARLADVVTQTPHPVLCKDFILDPVQVQVARQAGAAAVLLIVKILSDTQLRELTQAIRALNMTPLIEIQNEDELARALAVAPTILLMNNRDLSTLEIDLETTARLALKIPEGILKVSASGIQHRSELERLQPHCDGFLIGSALMREQPENLTRRLQELCGS